MSDLSEPINTEDPIDTLHNLEVAIQAYVAEKQHGGIVSDWALSVEHVDETAAANRNVLVYISTNMTAWKLAGFMDWAMTLYRAFISRTYAGVIRSLNDGS